MKRILVFVATLGILASCTISTNHVHLHDQRVVTSVHNQGVVTSINPVYVNVPARYYDTRCQDIYINRQTSSRDVFTGMVIGGIAGNAIGGNDRSTAIGAIVGGLIAADNRPQRVETRCQDVFVDEVRTRISHYRVEYIMNGRSYIYDTHEYYAPGSTIIVTPPR
jgi:uncharacterized protein YcfJ